MSSFAIRFKELRLEKKLTQEELIKDYNRKYNHKFTRQSLTHYERGRRIPETQALQDFANYFNVSLDYLLGRTNKRKEVVNKEDIKLKISRLIIDTLSYEGYDITEDDLPLLLKSIKFALDVRSGNL